MKKKSTFVIRIIASVVLVLLLIGDFAVIKSLRINDAQIRESESDGNVKKTEVPGRGLRSGRSRASSRQVGSRKQAGRVEEAWI